MVCYFPIHKTTIICISTHTSILHMIIQSSQLHAITNDSISLTYSWGTISGCVVPICSQTKEMIAVLKVFRRKALPLLTIYVQLRSFQNKETMLVCLKSLKILYQRTIEELNITHRINPGQKQRALILIKKKGKILGKNKEDNMGFQCFPRKYSTPGQHFILIY